MKNFYFLVYLMFTLQQVNSQSSFSFTYGTSGWDEAYDLEIDDNNNFIIAGAANYNLYNMCLIKMNSAGDTLWTRNYGGAGDDGAYALAKSGDGGYILAGWTNGPLSAGDYDMYVVKVNNAGTFQWEKAFGTVSTEWANDVILTTDGNYLIAGYSFSAASKKYGFAVKLDADGDSIWTKISFTTDTSKMQEFYSVQNTSDNCYIFCGYEYEYDILPVVANILLVKTNSDGTVIWSETFGEADINHIGKDVIEVSNGFVITGGKYLVSDYDPILLKTDLSGNQLWLKNYTDSLEKGEMFSVEKTNDNGFLLAGSTENGNKDVFIIKTDSTGNFQWSETFGGAGFDIGYVGKQTYDGGYIIVGSTTSQGAGQEDIYVIKTDASGKICNNFPGITVTTNTAIQGNPTIFTPVITGGNGNLTFNWNGDDGFSSTDSIPSYIFPSGPGNYHYSVTVTDNNTCVGSFYCLDSCAATVLVSATEEFTGNNSNFNIYPNPFDSYIYINYNISEPLSADIELYNVIGKKVYSDKIKLLQGNEHKLIFPKSLLTDNVYFLHIKSEKATIYKKLIKY